MVKHLRRLSYFSVLRHLRRLRYVLGRMAIRPARVLRHPLHAAMSSGRRDPGGESRWDLAVGERSVTHGPPTPPQTGVWTGRELPLLLNLQPPHG